ncbi:MAG TPA: hypothetical protein PLP33_29190 [Leptospiraceae bacterium]|nr:hypothetical protein [Leptospiraceae bacterium]
MEEEGEARAKPPSPKKAAKLETRERKGSNKIWPELMSKFKSKVRSKFKPELVPEFKKKLSSTVKKFLGWKNNSGNKPDKENETTKELRPHIPNLLPKKSDGYRTFVGYVDNGGSVFAKRLDDNEKVENILGGKDIYKDAMFVVPEDKNLTDTQVLRDFKAQLHRSWVTRSEEKVDNVKEVL